MEQTTKTVPISESIRFGWNAMKKNIGFFILLLLVYYGLLFITSLLKIAFSFFSNSLAIYILLNIVSSVFSLFLITIITTAYMYRHLLAATPSGQTPAPAAATDAPKMA